MILKPACWLPFLLLSVSCSPSYPQEGGSKSVVVSRSSHVYQTVNGDSLSLDLRIPFPSLDESVGVVFLHGGGFSQGHRSHGPHAALLDSLASKGIPSASVSYRLTRVGQGFGCNVTVSEKLTAVELAAQDLMAALQWLRASEMSLPSTWVAAGSSAGAEAALWAGYGLAPQDWAGVVSFSGAISDAVHLPQNAPPLFAIHGTCDAVVPPKEGIHRGCEAEAPGAWMLCGGLCLSERLSNAGIGSSSYNYCGGGHEVCNTAMLDPTLQERLILWLGNSQRRRTTARVRVTKSGGFKEGPGLCPQPCQ